MRSMPLIVNERCYDLFIILEQDNLERIKSYDPAEVLTANFPAEITDRKVRTVVILYATDDDMRVVMHFCERGDPTGALRYLSQGFRWRPELGGRDESGGD